MQGLNMLDRFQMCCDWVMWIGSLKHAEFWMLANARTLLLAPFDKFLVPY